MTIHVRAKTMEDWDRLIQQPEVLEYLKFQPQPIRRLTVQAGIRAVSVQIEPPLSLAPEPIPRIGREWNDKRSDDQGYATLDFDPYKP